MIEIKNLTQIYKSKKGIFDINITINDGEIFGYLGPNGAGKTTTIRNILGMVNADSGTVKVNGINPRLESEKLNQIVGYLPGEMAFFENYTGKEFLDFLCNMHHVSDYTKRNMLIEKFDLDIEFKIKKMSKGMKQKLGIVAAFMHDPQILILDEPTSGLDPLMQNLFLDLVLEEKKKGKTILMSSHIFEEVERVCDRAGIIKDGKIIKIEDFKEDKKRVEDLYIITLKEPNENLLKEDLNINKLDNGKYIIAVRHNYKKMFSILSKYDVINLETKKLTIEDIFMRYYSKEVK